MKNPTGMSMELSNYLVSWVVTYLGDLQPTYIGIIIYLLSSMDILVVVYFIGGNLLPTYVGITIHPYKDPF